MEAIRRLHAMRSLWILSGWAWIPHFISRGAVCKGLAKIKTYTDHGGIFPRLGDSTLLSCLQKLFHINALTPLTSRNTRMDFLSPSGDYNPHYNEFEGLQSTTVDLPQSLIADSPSAQVIPRETMAKVGYSPMVLDGMYHRREYETATRKESTWTTIGRAVKAFLAKLRDRQKDIKDSGGAPTSLAISSAALRDDRCASFNPRTRSRIGKGSISWGEVSVNANNAPKKFSVSHRIATPLSSYMRLYGPTRLLGEVYGSGDEFAARSRRYSGRSGHCISTAAMQVASMPRGVGDCKGGVASNLSQVSLLRSAAAARLSSRKSRGTSRKVSISKDSQMRVEREGWGGATRRSESDSLIAPLC
ncbi:hypothetical protein DFH06DRAFT_1410183 [Mycena polygramma]|nr:hypothetical protein DFH06DRAFT_1410183 [Mycena polygramma]